MTANGSFTLTSGGFFASVGAGQTLSVTGNALFQGGSLAVSGNTGTIDVGGSVTFAGTNATGQLPTLRCGGNWTADANFAPTSGFVELDGSGAQVISGTGVFKDLTIASGSNTSTSNLTVNGALIANGSLALSGALDANGNVTVGAAGALDVGGGTDTFAGSLIVNGTFTSTGTVVFDDSLPATFSSASPLPNVQIAKTSGATLLLGSDVTVNGNLTETSGALALSLGSGQTLTVNGKRALPGRLVRSRQQHRGPRRRRQRDVLGNDGHCGPRRRSGVAATGARTPTSPRPRGTVELNGAASTTIADADGGRDAARSRTLVIKNGTRTFANDFTIAAEAITIDPDRNAPDRRRSSRAREPGGIDRVRRERHAERRLERRSCRWGPQTVDDRRSDGHAEPGRHGGAAREDHGRGRRRLRLTVNGTLAAKDFVVKEMGPGGLVIDFGATIAAAPNDFRNGTLDFRTRSAPRARSCSTSAGTLPRSSTSSRS